MKKNIYLNIILFILFAVQTVNSQTLEQAKQLFKEGKYEEAKPVFESYVSRNPKNASYNQWYGVSLYETGEKEKALKYLEFASSRKIQEAYKYLGDLYFDLYYFEDAIKQYTAYIKTIKDPDIKAIFERKIEVAENGERMVKRVEDVQIIDSIIVSKKQFFNSYKDKTLESNIYRLTDIFETEARFSDVYMFINQRQTSRIFPFEYQDQGLNLFMEDKLADKWGNRKMLPQEINSSKDENYPFILSDGITLYFASQGHNSIGGYDIFVSRYNPETGKYFPAENLGMPFNSTANDYLYAIDEINNIGWFVTDRNQDEDNVIIYTFIPNKIREIIQDKTPDEERQLARITNIKNTWKKQDYNSLLSSIYKDKQAYFDEYQRKQSEEFQFYLDENTVYTKLSDFRSIDAKGYFQQYIKKQEEVYRLEEELSKWRNVYGKESNNGKNELKNRILNLEKQYNDIVLEPRKLANKAREAELNQLKK